MKVIQQLIEYLKSHGSLSAQQLEYLQCIKRQKPSIKILWNAISFDKYHSIVRGKQKIHGPAVQAYRAILSGNKRNDLGKYAWLLKAQEISYIYNLIQAQRKLFFVGSEIYGSNYDFLLKMLHQNYHPPVT